jgi:polysulfide reductase-like protein
MEASWTSSYPNENEPSSSREAKLVEIRREAERAGAVVAKDARPAGAPFPRASAETGYYGIPLLKQPQWTWEIPLYFFTGGASGASAVIGAMADWVGDDYALAKHARWLALGGIGVSSALLIADLGRPERFLNMLRVFKPQSPMSMGAWALAAFGTFAGATAFAKAVQERWDWLPVRVVGNVSQAMSAAFALPFHNYTGVLIGATVIPTWNKNIRTLPIHFGMSGVQAAVSILELMGHDDSRALNLLGMLSTSWESYEGVHLESRKETALEPLKRGRSGWVTRTGGALSGPVPLALRLLSAFSNGKLSRKARTAAALSGIAGSLLTRYGWMAAGHASAKNWRVPLEIPEEAVDSPAPSR